MASVQNPPITRWEYMSAWINQDWEVKTIVGYQGEDIKSLPQFLEFLNIVGAAGWELVALCPVDVGHRAFLKRPKF